MYYENQYKLINIWRDNELIHVFVTANTQEKYAKYFIILQKLNRELQLNVDFDYDGNQIYFVLDNFEDYNNFKNAFYQEIR